LLLHLLPFFRLFNKKMKRLMSLAIAKVLGYPVNVSVPGLLLAIRASAIFGIMAGIYPSFEATQTHPADIIRFGKMGRQVNRGTEPLF
jgi:ABC-type lipoprotein release transport system permease subunit